VRDLRTATSFLTRLRVGTDVGGPEDLARGVPWFPVVGCVLGFVVAAVYAGGRSVFPSFIAAALAIAVGVWATGAFHEDGLADTADAFGGARTREETLRILKDPRLGTYGVAALVFDVAIRVGALGALNTRAAFVVLPAAHALSRAGAVAMLAGPVASEEGLGASYGSVVTRAQITLAVVGGLVVAVVALGPAVVAPVVGVALASFVVGRIARRRIGGVTGDVLGCAQQVGEVVVLLAGLAFVRQGWLDIPWW
jgi:adenosylcobinamide-GDP ribazoletransferase